MRPFMTLAATGLVSLVMLKVLAMVAIPVAGAFLGFAFLLFKIAMVVALVLLAVAAFRRISRSTA